MERWNLWSVNHLLDIYIYIRNLLTFIIHRKEGRVVFVTGGAGTICSGQTRALVALGANACIIGRNPQKTEAAAVDIATARKGAKVIGIGGCDVRDVRCSAPLVTTED